MIIEPVENGYVIEHKESRRIANNLDEVFEYMLLMFENRADSFFADQFGKVKIDRTYKPWNE